MLKIHLISFIFFGITYTQTCNLITKKKKSQITKQIYVQSKTQNNSLVDPAGKTIEKRFLLPNNYSRVEIAENSFSQYLRQLPLKANKSMVSYFNGELKSNSEIYLGVVDQKIGNKDLHQCADAIIRLKAEYLWSQKDYANIHFNLTNGFRVDYTRWMNGERVKVVGNKTKWVESQSPSNSKTDFWSYLEFVFTYAGTASLSKELIKVDWENMKIGDILIQGGHPGHAIIVVDMAINNTTKKKIFMLAQSYMPAQETQILCNNNNSESPWYTTSDDPIITTPEWVFDQNDLKRFP